MNVPIRTAVPRTLAGLALILLGGALSGCVSTTVTRANALPAAHAEREIPQAELLNVNIAIFDPGVPAAPEQSKDADVFPDVRKAEARYMAFTLRSTLQGTGYWGAVRVVPEPIEHSEVLVTGKILESNGLLLKLQVKAVDASGRVWLDRAYEQEAAKYSYTESLPGDEEPFQGLYNRIADDLLAARQKLPAEKVRDIQHASQLRFAAGLAPDAFAPHLAQEKDRYRVVSLPAEDDPMMARIERIRRRDDAVVDTLDQHYRVFHDRVARPYLDWRAASYTETQKLRELRREAATRKVLGVIGIVAGIAGLTQTSGVGALASGAAIVGGAYVLNSGFEKSKDAKLNEQALQELGQSLDRDVAPQVVELQGKTVILSGSAKAQYAEWRRLLKDIYAAETGFTTETEPHD